MYKSNVNLAIIETLMGGRDDATNVFKNIEAALITSISYDHTEFLGPSLMDITMHKAELFKQIAPFSLIQIRLKLLKQFVLMRLHLRRLVTLARTTSTRLPLT